MIELQKIKRKTADSFEATHKGDTIIIDIDVDYCSKRDDPKYYILVYNAKGSLVDTTWGGHGATIDDAINEAIAEAGLTP